MSERNRFYTTAAQEEEVMPPTNVSVPGNVQAWREEVISQVLRVVAIIAVPSTAAISYFAVMQGEAQNIPIFWIACAVLVVFAFWRRVPYGAKASALVILIYSLAVFNLLSDAQTGDGFPFMMCVPILTILFFGQRASRVSLGIATLTLVAFAWAFTSGRIPPPLPKATDLPSWLSRIVVFVLLSLLLMIPQGFLFRHLANALGRSRELAKGLALGHASLEKQVATRTEDLRQRAQYLEATAEVAREATSVLDTQELLTRVVRLVSTRFDFYHTGIFLLNASGQWAVLQAASSKGGRRMLSRGHRLRVGEEGIVGYVTGEGRPRIALDVGSDAVYFDNPDLPETRSEIALPLRARGEIIGALDVQSREPEAFTDEDVAVLQTLADQVAMAISNARLFERVQRSLEAERRAYGELSREAWQALLRSQAGLEARYDPQSLLPSDGRWPEEMKRAMERGKTVRSSEQPSTTLAAPIKVRGHVIGVLDAHKPEGVDEWTPEEISLLETLADQLGAALESARLYADAHVRAVREQLVGEATASMRETLDVDAVMQTAAREIAEALALHDVSIRLNVADDRTD